MKTNEYRLALHPCVPVGPEEKLSAIAHGCVGHGLPESRSEGGRLVIRDARARLEEGRLAVNGLLEHGRYGARRRCDPDWQTLDAVLLADHLDHVRAGMAAHKHHGLGPPTQGVDRSGYVVAFASGDARALRRAHERAHFELVHEDCLVDAGVWRYREYQGALGLWAPQGWAFPSIRRLAPIMASRRVEMPAARWLLAACVEQGLDTLG